MVKIEELEKLDPKSNFKQHTHDLLERSRQDKVLSPLGK